MPREHPWRRSQNVDAERDMAEALWAIAAELHEMNRDD